MTKTSNSPTPALRPAESTSRFVEANGVKLHYLDYGTAGKQPMLCLHGGAAHAHWFDYVAPGFTPTDRKINPALFARSVHRRSVCNNQGQVHIPL